MIGGRGVAAGTAECGNLLRAQKSAKTCGIKKCNAHCERTAHTQGTRKQGNGFNPGIKDCGAGRVRRRLFVDHVVAVAAASTRAPANDSEVRVGSHLRTTHEAQLGSPPSSPSARWGGERRVVVPKNRPPGAPIPASQCDPTHCHASWLVTGTRITSLCPVWSRSRNRRAWGRASCACPGCWRASEGMCRSGAAAWTRLLDAMQRRGRAPVGCGQLDQDLRLNIQARLDRILHTTHHSRQRFKKRTPRM